MLSVLLLLSIMPDSTCLLWHITWWSLSTADLKIHVCRCIQGIYEYFLIEDVFAPWSLDKTRKSSLLMQKDQQQEIYGGQFVLFCQSYFCYSRSAAKNRGEEKKTSKIRQGNCNFISGVPANFQVKLWKNSFFMGSLHYVLKMRESRWINNLIYSLPKLWYLAHHSIRIQITVVLQLKCCLISNFEKKIGLEWHQKCAKKSTVNIFCFCLICEFWSQCVF